jgi:ribose transport system ATP-binding protein
LFLVFWAGRHISDRPPPAPRTPGEPLLRVSHLSGAHGKPADASLVLHRGEVLGIAGLMGAGRTELLRAVFGLDSMTGGEVTVASYRGAASPHRRWAQGAGILSEDRKGEGLALGLSVGDNLTLSTMAGLGPAGLVLPGRRDAASRTWIERLAIKCAGPRQRVADLSGGNQQKVAIARLLHHGADVLLLDEPTRGIDVGSKSQVYQLIDDLAAGRAAGGRPRAVLIVSSYLPELLGVCDRVAVMRRGRLGEARPVGELDEHTLLMEATGAGPDASAPAAVAAS